MRRALLVLIKSLVLASFALGVNAAPSNLGEPTAVAPSPLVEASDQVECSEGRRKGPTRMLRSVWVGNHSEKSVAMLGQGGAFTALTQICMAAICGVRS